MHSLQGICPLEISQNSTPRPKISDFFPRLYDLSLNDKGSLYAAVPSPIDEDIN